MSGAIISLAAWGYPCNNIKITFSAVGYYYDPLTNPVCEMGLLPISADSEEILTLRNPCDPVSCPDDWEGPDGGGSYTLGYSGTAGGSVYMHGCDFDLIMLRVNGNGGTFPSLEIADWTATLPWVLSGVTCVDDEMMLPKPAHGVEKLARGVAGLAKAALGIGRADESLITGRRHICGGCEHNVGGLLRRCELCGCALAAKTTLSAEKCPAGKW